MPANPNHVVLCPAGKWTKVLWGSFVFQEYTGQFSVPGVTIEWRRYSDLPPWHTFGTHPTAGTFGAILAGAYSDFWFMSPIDLTVGWTPK